MKHASFWLFLALAAGCGSSEFDTSKEEGPRAPGKDPIELRKDVDPGPSPWDAPGGQFSKSIHGADFNTLKGATFLNGALIVDNVLIHDSEDVISVNIRLRNMTDQLIQASYLMEFRSLNQDLILGHKRGWQPFVVDGHGNVVVSNSALIKGAVGFKLFVATKGSESQGAPDPQKKDQ